MIVSKPDPNCIMSFPSAYEALKHLVKPAVSNTFRVVPVCLRGIETMMLPVIIPGPTVVPVCLRGIETCNVRFA